ncbi:MAG: hypothetical protein RJA49_2615 [Actinomycetota bacterium]
MDSHIILATTRINSLTGLTAFSALPDAPVLPERPARIRTALAMVRRAVTRTPRPDRVAPEVAAATRMSACA